ncbi:hypothetical protein PsYK624_053500 [Phanerochaete sordida]|uniref:F-box domain-containing protein n=1 Tax=Phanerochaete sordida TaxID=48140 RepID=A0A9P3G8C3_9APHY|nr:hypothetical protein PsYK624_053500 [Phanerochaete sordida]
MASEDASCPINCLPTEVLAEVFHWCILHVRAAVDGTSSHLAPPAPYSWLSVRAVCRHWRAVALSYPTLSTHIWLTRVSCVDSIIKLSGHLPLHVYAIDRAPSELHEEDAELLGLVLRVSQRIAHAKFTLSKDTIDLLFSLGQDAFPHLSSLSFHVAEFWSPSELLFPNIAFPALRKLECQNLFLVRSLSTITSPRLHSLRLVGCQTTLKGQLLPLLQQLPGLEELVLKRALHDYSQTLEVHEILILPPNPLQMAALPHLKLLHIDEDSGDLVVMLIKYLSFPRSASMRLKAHWFSHFQLPSATYLSVLLVGLVEAAPQTLLVSCDPERFTLSLWDARLPASDAPTPRVVPPRFSCTYDSPPAPFVADVISALPLRHISSAYLDERPVAHWSAPHWASLLARTPALEELSLRYETFDVVSPGAAPYRAPPIVPPRLPNLKRVEICEMYHRSSARADFESNTAHLGVIAAALQSHAGVDLSKRRENFHGAQTCRCVVQGESRTFGDPTPRAARAAQGAGWKGAVKEYVARLSSLFK